MFTSVVVVMHQNSRLAISPTSPRDNNPLHLLTTTNHFTMADIIIAPVAPKPKKKSIFSLDAVVPVTTEGAKALDFFSRGRDTFERTLEENQRKQERKNAKLERKRSSASADLKENSPFEEKRRKVSAQKFTESRYSSEEASENERDQESPPSKRLIALQFVL